MIPTKFLNKINTPSALGKKFTFKFTLHLGCHVVYQHRYLRQKSAYGSKSKPYHQNHLPTSPDHHASSVVNCPEKVNKFIKTCFDSQIRIPLIILISQCNL